MLTCKTDERDLVRSWALGADAYLSKPTDPEQIAAMLRAHLAAAATPDPRRQSANVPATGARRTAHRSWIVGRWRLHRGPSGD